MIPNITLNKMDKLHALKKKKKTLKAKKDKFLEKKNQAQADLDLVKTEFDELEAEVIAEIKAL